MALPAERPVMSLNPFDQLADELRQIRNELKEIKSKISEPLASDKTMTPRQVQDYLKISAPTEIAWRKRGLLSFKRIGRRIFYMESEVRAAVTQKWSRD